MPARIVVVFYSRSGHTKQIAEQIARAVGADTEAIIDPTDRSGLRGYLRSGYSLRAEDLRNERQVQIGASHRRASRSPQRLRRSSEARSTCAVKAAAGPEALARRLQREPA